MNYKNIYNQIINNAKLKNRVKNGSEYYEEHHIIPKCIGGGNETENLVLLTFREHFVCHLLLVKIHHQNYKLVFALNALCQNERMTSRMYEKVRILYIKMLKNNSEWKNKIASTMCKKIWMKKESDNKCIRVFENEVEDFKKNGYVLGRSTFTRKSPSDETKRKISESNMGKPACKKAIETLIKKQKGKTYEELYGSKKAKELKNLRRKKMIETNEKFH
jgi:hypothetical protein